LKFDETDWDDVLLQHGTLGYYVPEEVNLNILPSIRALQSYDKSRRAKFYLFAKMVPFITNFKAENFYHFQ
jgi:hypothetical protein